MRVTEQKLIDSMKAGNSLVQNLYTGSWELGGRPINDSAPERLYARGQLQPLELVWGWHLRTYVLIGGATARVPRWRKWLGLA